VCSRLTRVFTLLFAMAFRGLILFFLVSGVSGHGTLIWPPARQGGAGTFGDPSRCRPLPGCWYFVDIRPVGVPKIKPFNAPGKTQIPSPCGTPAGKMPKISHSKDGLDLPARKVVKWEQGVDQPVAWNAWANHAGGIAYRLCRKDGKITEECFQKTHLKFTNDKTIARWKNGSIDLLEAKKTTEKSVPEGSEWMKNPIPMNCPDPAPANGLCGRRMPAVALIDKVHVPEDLAIGDYVMSWRWDAMYTPQVWTNCADVEIVKKGEGSTPLPVDVTGLSDSTPRETPQPETPQPEPEPEHEACEWKVNPRKYCKGYAASDSATYTLDKAKKRCLSLGKYKCKAVTCAGNNNDLCTVRGGDLANSPSGETTHVPLIDCFSLGLMDVQPHSRKTKLSDHLTLSIDHQGSVSELEDA